MSRVGKLPVKIPDKVKVAVQNGWVTLEGEVEKLRGFGAIVQLAPGVTGMVPTAVLRQMWQRPRGRDYARPKPPGVFRIAVDTGVPIVPVSVTVIWTSPTVRHVATATFAAGRLVV